MIKQKIRKMNSIFQNITVKKSFRKSLSLRVDRNGVIQVKAPFFVTKKQIDIFLEKHADWIAKQQEKLLVKLSESEIVDLISRAKTYIFPRVQELALIHGFSYEKIRITRAQTRWGSCSSRKTLSFSYRLMQYPKICIDYVIIHELCHLRQMNHSAKFWNEVERIMPEYREAEKILKDRIFTC